MRHAERVIAVSQRTASDAVRLLGVDPSRDPRRARGGRAGVLHRGRDEALPPLAARLGFDARQGRTLLFVGTLEPRKNVPLLLDAFARAAPARRCATAAGWRARLARRADLRRACAIGAGRRRALCGTWIDEDDLAVLYSHAGVLVLPSLYEGFGLPVLEAMACGTPVVCSNAGPLPEVAGDAAVLLPARRCRRPGLTAILNVLTQPRRGRAASGTRARASAGVLLGQRALATREVYREALLA